MTCTAPRLQFTVERGVLHTPSIEGNLELPASITVMGQTLDLAPLRDAVKPLQVRARARAHTAMSPGAHGKPSYPALGNLMLKWLGWKRYAGS